MCVEEENKLKQLEIDKMQTEQQLQTAKGKTKQQLKSHLQTIVKKIKNVNEHQNIKKFKNKSIVNSNKT